MLIRVAHSPDADDAFMFYALAQRKIDIGEYEFEHILEDIESLNQAALESRYEVTAVSFHAYPYIAENYALMTCGGSIGDGYGPIIVSKRNLSPNELERVRIGVPGKLTTARLVLKLFLPEAKETFMNFDEILPAVKRGNIEAGLIIHEGQISYAREGVYKVIDLGEWWKEKTNLPLPLGGNAVRRDLPEVKKIASLIKKSIIYSLEHENEALDYALTFGRGLQREEARKFVRMYVNNFTVNIGQQGKRAVEMLFEQGFKNGLFEREIKPDWVEV